MLARKSGPFALSGNGDHAGKPPATVCRIDEHAPDVPIPRGCRRLLNGPMASVNHSGNHAQGFPFQRRCEFATICRHVWSRPQWRCANPQNVRNHLRRCAGQALDRYPAAHHFMTAKRGLVALLAWNAATALIGAIGLIGGGSGMAADDLEGSPFDSTLAPGLTLLIAVSGAPSWRSRRCTGTTIARFGSRQRVARF